MNPPPERKWLRIWIGAIFGVLALLTCDLLLVQARRRIPVGFDTTRITSPTGADGTIDYVAALDVESSRGVTADNNAIPLLIEAFGPAILLPKVKDAVAERLHMPLPPNDGPYLIAFDDFQNDLPADKERLELDFLNWPMGNAAEVAKWVKVNEKPLELIRRAAARPRCFMPMRVGSEERTILSMLMPHLNALRSAAMLLGADAQLRADAGDFKNARADVRAMHQLARLTSQGPTVIARLVGSGIEALACNTSRNIAHHAKVDAATADAFLKDVLSEKDLPSLSSAVDVGERYLVLEFALRMATRGPAATARLYGNGPQMSNPLSYWFLPIPHADAMRLENAAYDAIVAAQGKPTYAERKSALQTVSRVYGSTPPGLVSLASPHILLAMLLPSMVHAEDRMESSAVELELTQIVWGLVGYHVKHDKYPETLAELAPQYLPTIPIDPFSMGPLIYSPAGDGYTLYSVGPNMTDDKGASTQPADDIDASLHS